MTKTKPLFEHQACTRCGGSGEYSYNQMHGSRCYGCSGTGYQLTARGKAAQQYLNALRKIPAEQFKVGDLICYDDLGSLKWVTVTSVTLLTGAEAGYLSDPDAACVKIVGDFRGKQYGINGFVGQTRCLKGFTADEKQAQREQALAYQATLTKAGKPAKARKTEEAA